MFQKRNKNAVYNDIQYPDRNCMLSQSLSHTTTSLTQSSAPFTPGLIDVTPQVKSHRPLPRPLPRTGLRLPSIPPLPWPHPACEHYCTAPHQAPITSKTRCLLGSNYFIQRILFYSSFQQISCSS